MAGHVWPWLAHGRIVEGDANSAAMVAIVLPDDAPRGDLPQAGIVVGAGGDEVGGVGAERAVPHPALVAVQGDLELERVGLGLGGGGRRVGPRLSRLPVRVDGPDAGGVVGAAGGQVADVGREQDAGDVGGVGGELADGDERGDVAVLDQAPDVDVALGGSACV